MNQKQIFALVDKFEESRLAELSIEAEDFKITLKSPQSFTQAAAVPSAIPVPAPVAPAGTPVPQAEAPQTEAASGDTEVINSPIVGTFYRSPSPDSPPFVEAGSVVSAGDSICIIEAMKIMNKLEAEFSCEIVKVLAENGQLIDFESPLFEVKRK